ncbi:MAG: hypothetical protein FJ278_24540 [Planctomycetes bacterium]|nr:hypothetical protein [Planctomycetota bacterium]
MDESDADRLSEAECVAEFDRLFPEGFAGRDVLAELAPDGWDKSPLLAVFHPSLDQVYEESLRFHRNLQSLPWRKPDAKPKPEPTREEVAKDFHETPIETEREVRELVGQCLWDVFSDNHDVIAADGRIMDLGSFRGSGGFIADWINRQTGESRYDYIDFYMGTIWVSQRADLTPVYQMIFRRLKARRMDWAYHFPRIRLVDMRPVLESLEPPAEPEWATYSPSEAFAQQQEEEKHEREMAKLRDDLDKAHRESIEDAKKRPPPDTVRAYFAVYGRFPRGWPPEAPAEGEET